MCFCSVNFNRKCWRGAILAIDFQCILVVDFYCILTVGFSCILVVDFQSKVKISFLVFKLWNKFHFGHKSYFLFHFCPQTFTFFLFWSPKCDFIAILIVILSSTINLSPIYNWSPKCNFILGPFLSHYSKLYFPLFFIIFIHFSPKSSK